jgi:hypothetical protein
MKRKTKERKVSSRMVSFAVNRACSYRIILTVFARPDNFIVDRREPRQERDGSLPPGDDDVDFGDTDGDASHRRLDRRRMAKKDQEAAALAEELDARYKKNKYKAGDNDDWAPQALLMPSVNDPSIWAVKCKVRLKFLFPLNPKRISEPDEFSLSKRIRSVVNGISFFHSLAKLQHSKLPTTPPLSASSPLSNETLSKVSSTSKLVQNKMSGMPFRDS